MESSDEEYFAASSVINVIINGKEFGTKLVNFDRYPLFLIETIKEHTCGLKSKHQQCKQAR